MRSPAPITHAGSPGGGKLALKSSGVTGRNIGGELFRIVPSRGSLAYFRVHWPFSPRNQVPGGADFRISPA